MNIVMTQTANGSQGNTAFIKDVLEFHKLFNQYIGDKPEIPNEKVCNLRIKLSEEELQEFKDGIEANDLIEVADALADRMYVLCGDIVSFGLGDKFYEIFQEVQRSNMSKACKTPMEALDTQKYYLEEKGTESIIKTYDEGKTYVVESLTGKTLKSIAYSPANIKDILDK